MNAKPLRTTLICLLICLSLALAVAQVRAQRRTQAKPAQPKPTPGKTATKPTAQTTPATAQQVAAPAGKRAQIRWRGRPGVERYRLQVARDREFRDIVFDRAVVGLEYQVELPAGGRFFWRGAPPAPGDRPIS